MKIDQIKKGEENCDKYDIIFVNVSKQEALSIIKSLTEQMIAESSNVGRVETFADCGTYFSMGVDFSALDVMARHKRGR